MSASSKKKKKKKRLAPLELVFHFSGETVYQNIGLELQARCGEDDQEKGLGSVQNYMGGAC